MASDLFDLDEDQERRAERLHENSIVVDGLVPTDSYLGDPDYDDHLQAGGVTAGNFTVAHFPHDFAAASDELVAHRDHVEAAPEEFTIVESAADVRAAHENGQVGVILGFQDTRPIEADLGKLRAFDHLGVRVVQLTYNDQNYVGSGCCERHDAGLSEFGLELIEELNDRGVLIDLSHCADTTTMEAIEHSADPVAFTHVGARAVCNAYGRNKTDEQLTAIADNGGVVGISFFPPLVKRDPDTHEVQPGTVHDVLDAIDHAVGLVGVEHVGFGTDMNDSALDRGVTPPGSSLRHYRPTNPEVFGRGPTERYDPFPEGVERHTKLQNLTRGLVARGYTDDEIEMILGGNFLRLFETVWGE